MDKNFFENVFDVVAQIPKGRVTSYGAIAKYLGSARSARMVGWALNKSISSNQEIPAHRVLNRNGLLSGKIHFNGKSMIERLEDEGIEIKNDQVMDLDKFFWDPMIELEL
jgi:methylated-DNA-protein-cysteine methyltransferase-like protein